jgi:hypothetical protein
MLCGWSQGSGVRVMFWSDGMVVVIWIANAGMKAGSTGFDPGRVSIGVDNLEASKMCEVCRSCNYYDSDIVRDDCIGGEPGRKLFGL